MLFFCRQIGEKLQDYPPRLLASAPRSPPAFLARARGAWEHASWLARKVGSYLQRRKLPEIASFPLFACKPAAQLLLSPAIGGAVSSLGFLSFALYDAAGSWEAVSLVGCGVPLLLFLIILGGV